MANTALSFQVPGYWVVDLKIWHNFLQQHSYVEIPFGGSKPSLKLFRLMTANMSYLAFIANLTPDCKLIAIRSRQHTNEDINFINTKIKRIFREGIIQPSQSTWRVQVLVTSSENHKNRMVIDYSQTINKFILLDAYPLLQIDMIRDIAKCGVYSTLDIWSAYQEVTIKPSDKVYTAFKAEGWLYEFWRIPFDVMNGMASFQRIMDEIILKEKLKSTIA